MVNVHIKNNQLCFAFLKEMVIQPSAAIKSLLKQSGLFVGGENPVSKSFSHGYMRYTNCLKVKNYFLGAIHPPAYAGGLLAKLR